MLQVKSPSSEGMALRGPGGGEIWLSPQRDLFHCFIPLLGKSFKFVAALKDTNAVLKYMNEDGVLGDQDMTAVANVIAAIVSKVTESSESVDIRAVAKEAGLNELPRQAMLAFCYAFFCVTLSAYAHGANEAKAGSYKPFLFGAIEDITYPEAEEGVVRRFLKRFGW